FEIANSLLIFFFLILLHTNPKLTAGGRWFFTNFLLFFSFFFGSLLCGLAVRSNCHFFRLLFYFFLFFICDSQVCNRSFLAQCCSRRFLKGGICKVLFIFGYNCFCLSFNCSGINRSYLLKGKGVHGR